MAAEILIRRMIPNENAAIHEFVQSIADETFAYLFKGQVTLGEAKWSSAWLAISGEEIVGVAMTRDDWLTDLWVRKDARRIGIGTRLMAQAEREIRSRGYGASRLRVVKSNTVAVQFYENQGWRVYREFPHEKFEHSMFEMIKSSEAALMPSG